MSGDFQKFYESLLAAARTSVFDGPHVDSIALCRLRDEERSLAERLLIERIEAVGEPVIEALADMKSQQGAEALKRYAKKLRGGEVVPIALALWRIERWPKSQKILIDVLEGRSKQFRGRGLNDFHALGRAEAARALAFIPGSRTELALSGAISDPDRHVRNRAQSALSVVKRFGRRSTGDSDSRGHGNSGHTQD